LRLLDLIQASGGVTPIPLSWPKKVAGLEKVKAHYKAICNIVDNM